ncbi:MAG: hypothetical protein QNJ94_05790 [Alphaproteobacteria bacterium]|nr:hypothetical protein [Alphaproteobacteria bacterium]
MKIPRNRLRWLAVCVLGVVPWVAGSVLADPGPEEPAVAVGHVDRQHNARPPSDEGTGALPLEWLPRSFHLNEMPAPEPQVAALDSMAPAVEYDPIGEGERPKDVEPITRVLPIWGEAAREQGYTLPLPFGAGASIIFMDQDVELSEVRLGVDGQPATSSGVTLTDVQSRDFNVTFRPDVWLFPFLNVYGIFGYTAGETDPTINIPALEVAGVPLTNAITVRDEVEYGGPTVGVGGTIAGGYQSFFGAVDINWTYSDLNVSNSEIFALTISPRVGIVIDEPTVLGAGSVWLGAMYQDYSQTITGSVNLNEIDPAIAGLLGDQLAYELEIEAQDPWNMLVGGAWEFTPRWHLAVEVGFIGRTQALGSLTFRF